MKQEDNWIILQGLNVPSSKNSKILTGKRIIKSKLCQNYIKWATPLLQSQKEKWEKIKSKHPERPLRIGFYYFRDSTRIFDANNVSQILCDLMVENGYVDDDNVYEMVPVYLTHKIVYDKKESGVWFTIISDDKENTWKPVLGFEDEYLINGKGDVLSLNYGRTGKEKIRHPSKDANGYLVLGLHKDGKSHFKYIARLVWEAFNGEIPDGCQVNHMDENPLNNRIGNLELTTIGENITYGKSCRKRIKERIKKVYQYTLDGKLYKVWESTMDCKRNGFNQGQVAGCCRGEKPSYRGYLWSYNKEENLTYSPKTSGKNDKRKKSVIQYTINGELVREYKSATETEKYGFNRSCVSACCRGKKGMKTHKGYVWKYK